MNDALDAQLLVASQEELRALHLADDEASREAVVLALAAHDALASSVAAENPRELTAVVIARYRRRWKWRMLLIGVFVPFALLALALFGTAAWALFTAFIWRP